MFSRKIAIIAGFLIAGAVTLATANERSAVWARLYRRATSLEDKHALMQSAVLAPSQDLIPMLLESIGELILMREQITTVTQRNTHTELTKIVVRTIGEIGAVEAAVPVYDIARTAEDPYLRGEAIFTIGRLGLVQYAGDIAIMLRNINLNLDTRREDKVAEVLAYACVLALERLKAPIGYSPLFYASIGWYSPRSGVRPKAAEAMRDLIDDPTEILSDIVRLESNVQIKLEALKAEAGSRASLQNKSLVAVEALRQGLIRQPADVAESSAFGQLRLLAMELLIANPADSREAIDYLAEVMTGTFDINERITAMLAIGAQQTGYAVEVLVRYLAHQNDRQLSGVTASDYRIIRSTIQVLGRVGNDLAVEELLAVGLSNWPPSIAREANTALEALEALEAETTR